MIQIIQGDCLIESDKIESGSVDLILTDLPYGNMKRTSNCKAHTKLFGNIDEWDNAIEPKSIYEIANRILRKNGKMILFSQEPYTSSMITKSIPNIPFIYRAIWEKDNFANVLAVNQNMVGYFEDILVYSKKQCYTTTNPLRGIMNKYVDKYGSEYLCELLRKEGRYTTDLSARVHTNYKFGIGNGRRFDCVGETMYNYLCEFIEFSETFNELELINNKFKKQTKSTFNLWEGNKYKSNILKYKKDYTGHHPTQKPVLLLEDLIKTFSNENDLVVDLTMGSGSTGVACVNTNRSFTGIEMNEEYFNIASERVGEKRKEKDFTVVTSFGEQM